MEVEASSTTGSRNPSPSLPEEAQYFEEGGTKDLEGVPVAVKVDTSPAIKMSTESTATSQANGAAVEQLKADEIVLGNATNGNPTEENTAGPPHPEIAEKAVLVSNSQDESNSDPNQVIEDVQTVDAKSEMTNSDLNVKVKDDDSSQPNKFDNGSREGSVSGGSCEESASGGSREGSVSGGSREGSVSGESREGSVSCEANVSGGVVTEAMLDEEKRLLEGGADNEVPEEVEDLRNMVEQQRYGRLLHLLQRSTIYSTFLLKRMEGQQEEDKKKESKKKKTTQGALPSPVTPGRLTRSSTAGKSPTVTQTDVGAGKQKRGRKRKASGGGKGGSFKISDYMDSQGKLKKMKMDNEEEALVSVPLKKKSPSKPHKQTERYFEGQLISPRQPALLSGGVMRSYQLDGMEWIKLLYENGVNGILGDEMGLGKTIQCISVISYMIERGVKGPFLVAAPLSTVPNWVSEFKRFAPKIPVVLYHGSMSEREQLRKTLFLTQEEIQRKADKKKKHQRKKSLHANSTLVQDVQPVVVTSYEICMRDQKYLQDRSWKFLVVDEGHRIKNLNCKLIRTLKAYDAANRLLLTGTPLQNNLAELWSLLNFLLPDIFDDLNSFQSWFDFDMAGDDEVKEKIIAQEREQNVLRTLHQILTPFLLRRLKTDVEYSLPPKKEVLVYAPLTAHQEKFYKSLLDRSILDLLEQEKKEKLGTQSTDNDVDGDLKRSDRRKTNKANYSQLTDDQFDSIMTGDSAMDDFVPQEEDQTSKKKEPTIQVSAVNIKMTSVWTQLRKCSNHPYLLEFPLTADGEFKVDEELVQCCGKTRMLDRLLTALIKDGHKTLIFSQFTTMLDILEDYMELRNISCSRLDGSMPFALRQLNMTKFKSDPKCMVFLLSTRAAGLGLNLTSADTVIIYDSDWNPQCDLQAQDRCHRIGQTNPVMVYRLVTSNTIDQRIVERAASKRKLEKMVIHKGKFKGNTTDTEITLDDLSELLHSVDHDKVVNSNGEVISDEALTALLDRTVKTTDTNLSTEGIEGDTSGPEHTGLFKVLEEIGNTVCNRAESTATKNEDETKNVKSDNKSEIETDVVSENVVTTTESEQVSRNDLQTVEEMECDEVGGTDKQMELTEAAQPAVEVSAG